MILTLCGLTSQKTHRGGLGLGGSVHEKVHPCFPYLVQPSFKSTDAGSIYTLWSTGFHLLITLFEKKLTAVSRAPKLN